MTKEQPTECLKCGAAVIGYAKHRSWHEALEKLLPGLDAERERISEAKRPGRGRGF